MKKTIFTLCVVVLIIVSTLVIYSSKNYTTYNQVNTYKTDIVGMWHASPSVGAGYRERYEMLQDGNFVFYFSQYDGEKRTVEISGEWNIIYGNLLQLVVTDKKVIEGGEFVKEKTSEISEYVLRGGNLVNKKVQPEEIIIYPLGDIEVNDDYPYPIMMKIGGIQYWKLEEIVENIN